MVCRKVLIQEVPREMRRVTQIGMRLRRAEETQAFYALNPKLEGGQLGYESSSDRGFRSYVHTFLLKLLYNRSMVLSQNYSISKVEIIRLLQTLKLHPPSRRTARNRPTQALQTNFSGRISAEAPGTQA